MLTTYMVLSFSIQWILYILMIVYIIKLLKKDFRSFDKFIAFFGIYSLTLFLNVVSQVIIGWLSLKHDGGIERIIANELGEISALAFSDNIIRDALFKVGSVAFIGSIVWQTFLSAVVIGYYSIMKLINKFISKREAKDKLAKALHEKTKEQ